MSLRCLWRPGQTVQHRAGMMMGRVRTAACRKKWYGLTIKLVVRVRIKECKRVVSVGEFVAADNRISRLQLCACGHSKNSSGEFFNEAVRHRLSPHVERALSSSVLSVLMCTAPCTPATKYHILCILLSGTDYGRWECQAKLTLPDMLAWRSFPRLE